MLNREQTKSDYWLARLNLEFCERHGQTVMADNTHSGPLRVQRTFSEQDGSKHVYILHPPGGYVAGDVIDIAVTTKDQTHVVATSPGAAKFYRCEIGHPLSQKQTITLKADGTSLLEWLPQETIFFKDANADLDTHIHLRGGANFLGWEVSCLGRTASGEDFGDGKLQQSLNLFKDDILVHRERIRVQPDDEIHTRPWGLDGQVVFGTLIAQLSSNNITTEESQSHYAQQDLLTETVEQLRQLFAGFDQAQFWSVTHKTGIILVRYLGPNSETCKQGFVAARKELLQTFKQIDAALPRIWAT